MEHDDDGHDLSKDHHHLTGLSVVRHIEEHTEDIEGKEGDDALVNDLRHDVFELGEDSLQGAQSTIGNAKTHDE